MRALCSEAGPTGYMGAPDMYRTNEGEFLLRHTANCLSLLKR
jgi:hypothetical protein